ncbi:MAG: DUF3048 domain-containing protein [Candidatus Limnocylindria bacterium]
MDRIRRLGRRGLAAAASVVALVIVLAVWFLFVRGATPVAVTPSPSASASAEPTTTSSPSPSPTSTPDTRVACPLNGLPVDDSSLLAKTAIAVQIDDHPLARPARNLSNADMVVEVPVEGDTTRFSAVFLCRATIGLTGPIRSARYYEVDLWQDLHVLPIGFGASPISLGRFAAAGMPYVNGISGGWPWFRRAGTYGAPHNVYGDLEAMRSAIGSGGPIDRLVAKVPALRPPFAFDPNISLPVGQAVSQLEIRTNSYWRFGWSWNAATRLWTRQDAGKTVTDEVTGEPLTVSHVLVQRVTQEVVYGDPDPGGNPRRLQHFVGQGNGVLYSGGMAIALHWSRPTAADGTHWTYADSGAPVVLPPGVVWWEVVPTTASVTQS